MGEEIKARTWGGPLVGFGFSEHTSSFQRKLESPFARFGASKAERFQLSLE
jgi:hypothetical protein